MIVYDKNIFGSNREIDGNGYLRVDSCNITKTQVSPYLGREIPGWKDMGLEAEKIYYVLRPEEELKKAVPTFNNLPLTREHIEVDVENVPKDKIVGSLGDHAEYADGYLKNNLIVYDQKDIDLIMSGKKKELSCGYRYTPVREHGTFDGQEYDFVMKNIIGNHVALVKEGRAGHDVVVSDTIDKVKEKFMNLFRKKEIVEDAKLSEKEQEKVGVVMKEFKEGELKSGSGEKVTDPKQAIAIALSEADKMAKDKDIPDEQEKPEKAGDKKALVKGEEEMTEKVKEALAEEEVKKVEEAEDACSKAEDKKDDELAEDKDVDKRKLIDEIGGILKSEKVDDEIIRTVMKKCEEMAYNKSESGEADDEKLESKKDFAEGVKYGEEKEKEEPKKLDSEHESEGMKKADEKKAEENKEAEDEDKKEEKMAKDSALAMDVDAIKEAVRQEMKADFMAREEARKAVRSIVGDVNVMTFDSAEEIYKFACGQAGMDLNEIASYKDAFKGLTAGKSKLALDASPKCGSNEECFKDIRIA